MTRYRWLIIALSFFGVLVSWSLTTPVGGFPDDAFHFANIWCDEGIAEFGCESIENGEKRLVPNVFTDGSPWWDLTGRGTTWRYPDEVYPRIFYLTMKSVINDDVVPSVFRMRLLNSFIALLTFCLAVWICPRRLRSAFFISWLVAGSGLAFYYIASNHPLSWLIVGGGTLWVFLAALGESRNRTSRAIAVVGSITSTILVLGARPEGQAVFILSVVVGMGALLTSQRALQLRLYWVSRTARSKSLILTAGIFVFGGVAAFGLRISSQTSVVSISTIRRRFGGEFLNQLVDLPQLLVYVVGSNARNSETGVLGPQSIYLFIAFSGVLLLGSTSWWIGKSLAGAVSLGVLIFAPFGMVSDLRILLTPPRYLVIFLILLLTSMLLRDNPKVSLSEMRTLRSICGVLVIGHSLALHSAIRPYHIGEPPDWMLGLNGGLKWWWPNGVSPQSVWLIGTILFLVMTVSISSVLFTDEDQEL